MLLFMRLMHGFLGSEFGYATFQSKWARVYHLSVHADTPVSNLREQAKRVDELE